MRTIKSKESASEFRVSCRSCDAIDGVRVVGGHIAAHDHAFATGHTVDVTRSVMTTYTAEGE